MDPVKLGGVRALAEELMEMELAEHIGAERHERTAERTGSRERPWDTRVGTIELKVPRVRDGSFLSESAGTATSC
jgi:transposase-like protein